MRSRVTSALAVLAVLLTPFLGPARPAAAAATTRVTVLQWNIAGWTTNKGGTGAVIDKVLTEVAAKKPDFIALNEVCWAQYTTLITRLRAAGWPVDEGNFARFQASLNGTTPTSKACNKEQFGNAIFSRQALGAAGRFVLSQDPSVDGDEQRNLLCAPVSGSTLRICTAHTTPGSAVGGTQLEEIRAHVEAYEAAGETVFLAGDLNAQPDWDRFNKWYSSAVNTTVNPNNQGTHRELDDRDPICAGYGEGTTSTTTDGPCGTGAKIDMIFVREDHIASYSGDSLPLHSASDHRIMWGWADVY